MENIEKIFDCYHKFTQNDFDIIKLNDKFIGELSENEFRIIRYKIDDLFLEKCKRGKIEI